MLRPNGYQAGPANGIDHGIRLRAELRLPVTKCSFCGQTHASIYPATQVTVQGNNAVYHTPAGGYVFHG